MKGWTFVKKYVTTISSMLFVILLRYLLTVVVCLCFMFVMICAFGFRLMPVV